jgi:hypothetical protein
MGKKRESRDKLNQAVARAFEAALAESDPAALTDLLQSRVGGDALRERRRKQRTGEFREADAQRRNAARRREVAKAAHDQLVAKRRRAQEEQLLSDAKRAGERHERRGRKYAGPGDLEPD